MIDINKFNKFIAANWKLNGSLGFVGDFFRILNAQEINPKTCCIICPPLIYLQNCNSQLKNIYLGAQNCSNYQVGAYTGEVSALMLKENNCEFCIIGHSERRQVFGDTSEDISIKAKNLINNDILPIICIGETLNQKNNGDTKNILRDQLFKSIPKSSLIDSIVIAYEPIWSIGTGKTANLEEIEEIHEFLDKEIKEFNIENYKILYGGSVKSSNADDIVSLNKVDGVLVGGASLKPKEFINILKA